MLHYHGTASVLLNVVTKMFPIARTANERFTSLNLGLKKPNKPKSSDWISTLDIRISDKFQSHVGTILGYILGTFKFNNKETFSFIHFFLKG